jgi:antitoxin component of MazEF toxin-antitoxin module
MNTYSTLRSIKISAASSDTAGSGDAVLPAHILKALGAEVGDFLSVKSTSEGLLIAYDPMFSKAMKAADKIMEENREAFAALAKM